ncbi:MAG: glycosyltransferase [bacterium]|nr:glycosyltransferase [bacterium]
MEDLPFISIIFPTRNRADLALATLASLRELDYPRERMEILIWDNASSDDSSARIRQALKAMEPEDLLAPNPSDSSCFLERGGVVGMMHSDVSDWPGGRSLG